MQKTKTWAIVLTVLAFGTSFVAGCGATQQAPERTPTGAYTAPAAPVPNPGMRNGTVNPAPDTRTPATGTNQQDLHTAKKIADALGKMPGIGGATVLVGYKTAYVAVNAKGQPSSAMTTQLKSSITAKVKQMDPTIQTVLITEDPDVFQHFQAYAKDINAGRPISGFWNQFQDIVHRIWPTQR
ncbi:YhcN/YlaJ family sporulation lipoprotein [Fodinisporobacter ferrooxydans]|uniref:YhcN/YlaJ family sporulation lipoprotein n=1 Tax=Fodinisporobacter ferrooxydans TaxID=2901836 RepID=A0ABY4CKU8_9BACL|nr:YhcN/YlaJ family sporulation lipoprotein [Alicyclobacillaceae bacterium MYW30-H2]